MGFLFSCATHVPRAHDEPMRQNQRKFNLEIPDESGEAGFGPHQFRLDKLALDVRSTRSQLSREVTFTHMATCLLWNWDYPEPRIRESDELIPKDW